MERRNFLSKAGVLTAAIGSGLLVGCNGDGKAGDQTNSSTDSSAGLQTNPSADPAAFSDTGASGPGAFNIPAFAVEEWTIDQFQQAMARGTYTARALTELFFSRMDQVDVAGPRLQAVIERNPDALKIADQLDAERKAGRVRGPMHGIPVLLKDNIDTGDAMLTTAGSLAMMKNRAVKDAHVVRQLRESGAVILGKTNLSEWANFRSSQSCSGWSSRGGQTRMPYITDRNPCGSSAGSGVAVSANLCVVAVGTETDGSIVCPAAVNGIVGLKPTVGLISRSGIIPISSTQDTAGPMARTVRDVAILLGALTGTDPSDPVTRDSASRSPKDFTGFLTGNTLRGKRIGVEKKPQGTNQYMHRLQSAALQVLRSRGAEVVEIEYLDRISDLGEAEFTVMQYEFKAGLNAYLGQSAGNMKSLADVIRFNREHEDQAMPYFKQETLEASEKKGGLGSEEYLTALKKSRDGSRSIIDRLMKDTRLDAIAGLTMGPACSIDTVYGDRWGEVFLTQPAATSGYPHITVPAGMVYELPVGLSFFGAPYSEGLLLGLAYDYEQASRKRVRPAFQSTM